MDLNIELDMNEFANELTRDPDPLPASAAGELPFVTERPAPRAVADDDEATGARVAAVAAPTSSAKAPYKPPAPKLPPGLGAKPAVAPAPKLSPGAGRASTGPRGQSIAATGRHPPCRHAEEARCTAAAAHGRPRS
jgi:hypothetical protein